MWKFEAFSSYPVSISPPCYSIALLRTHRTTHHFHLPGNTRRNACPSRTTSARSMKGLAGSAGSVAVIALGLFPGASAESLRQEPAELEATSVVHVAELPSTNALDGSHSRRLQRGRGRGRPRPSPPVINDDALDVNGTVSPDSFSVQKFPHSRRA